MRDNILLPTAREILNVKQESGHEWTFRVKTDDTVKPGQFMQLSIPRVGEAPISVSEQGEGWLEFTLRPVGKVTDVIFRKQAGEFLFLRGPYGNGWPIDRLDGKNLVVITGGTGLAPVRSLLNRYNENPDKREDLYLIAGFKDAESVVFKEDLNRWKGNFHTTYTLDYGNFEDFSSGMVTAFVKDIPWSDFGDNYAVVVVGPPPMMKFTGLELLKNGVEEDRIWMSFERKMSCAVGKCGHCRIDEVYVCLDGPVFNYTTAKNLVD
mgnify:CR=1 FL=1